MIILIGFLIGPLVTLGGIIFVIMGILRVVNNETKPLPLIGGFKLLK